MNKMNNINDINSLYYFLYLYSSVNINLIKQWRIKIENSTQAETMFNRPFSNDSNKKKCDKSKPFCLYNNEENNIYKNKQFLVHKLNHEIKYIDNYFFENNKNNDDNNNINKEKEINNINIEKQLNLEFLDEINISSDSLLIERQKHLCGNEK